MLGSSAIRRKLSVWKIKTLNKIYNIFSINKVHLSENKQFDNVILRITSDDIYFKCFW